MIEAMWLSTEPKDRPIDVQTGFRAEGGHVTVSERISTADARTLSDELLAAVARAEWQERKDRAS